LPDVNNYEGYFFDLDGTVLLGDRLLPGVKDAIDWLRSAGKQVRFLSNTTVRTRKECLDRLSGLGLEARLHEIVTAAYVSAVYLGEIEPEPIVLVVGEAAVSRELEERAVAVTDRPEEATHVLVGMDMSFDYVKLHRAMKAVRRGAKMIAANPDPNCPVPGDVIPDTWPLVKAIEAASGVEPSAVIGKPSAYYAAKVLEESGLTGERCLMIGDRLETDVLFGEANGMATALVLTGVASASDAERSPIRADYVWSSMEQFLSIARPGAR